MYPLVVVYAGNMLYFDGTYTKDKCRSCIVVAYTKQLTSVMLCEEVTVLSFLCLVVLY
jgi:hypothetical protein